MPKRIYQCLYCGHIVGKYQHEDIIKVTEHEAQCVYNPVNKKCASCWDYGSKHEVCDCCIEIRTGNKQKYSSVCVFYKPHQRYNIVS